MLHHVTLSESQIRPVAKLHVCFFESMENAATCQRMGKKQLPYTLQNSDLQPKMSEEFLPGIANKFGLIKLAHYKKNFLKTVLTCF